ncbi:HIT family protein [Orrella daihaiensis]|uniref:HIT family protein n=1 Tax=Orrella daihaiensis TaxID=2782176 RepID=A0ABY4AII3_9BURK|nr:HIT family protein [Orrella daihaiensis]UOD49989.1 HIT family protein [Orrella daihaiensis]
MTTSNTCIFCSLPATSLIDENELAFAVRDIFPVNPGHTLLIPKRHVSSCFELTDEETLALMQLLRRAKEAIDAEFKPDDYNIGVNNGPLAGQTVPHVHIHVMPRYRGDVDDIRGGVRNIILERAVYRTNE